MPQFYNTNFPLNVLTTQKSRQLIPPTLGQSFRDFFLAKFDEVLRILWVLEMLTVKAFVNSSTFK